jgi:alpha-beta hydrolase superfamily lysophospholipase
MLILPPGHAKQVAARRGHLHRRERWFAGVAAAVSVALAVGGSEHRKGCLDVTFASSTGAGVVAGCGAAARPICAADGTTKGYTGTVGRQVAARCRELGLAVGG